MKEMWVGGSMDWYNGVRAWYERESARYRDAYNYAGRGRETAIPDRKFIDRKLNIFNLNTVVWHSDTYQLQETGD